MSRNKEQVQKRIAINVVHARMQHSISRAGLAHKIGINNELLNKYEKGELPIPPEDLEAISRELGVDIDWF